MLISFACKILSMVLVNLSFLKLQILLIRLSHQAFGPPGTSVRNMAEEYIERLTNVVNLVNQGNLGSEFGIVSEARAVLHLPGEEHFKHSSCNSGYVKVSSSKSNWQ